VIAGFLGSKGEGSPVEVTICPVLHSVWAPRSTPSAHATTAPTSMQPAARPSARISGAGEVSSTAKDRTQRPQALAQHHHRRMQPEEVQGLHQGLVDQIGPLPQQVQPLVSRGCRGSTPAPCRNRASATGSDAKSASERASRDTGRSPDRYRRCTDKDKPTDLLGMGHTSLMLGIRPADTGAGQPKRWTDRIPGSRLVIFDVAGIPVSGGTAAFCSGAHELFAVTKGAGGAGPSGLALLMPSAEAGSRTKRRDSLMEKIAWLVLTLVTLVAAIAAQRRPRALTIGRVALGFY
jgi:hypothetical protein